MKRRERESAVPAGSLPPELALGRCIEVWSATADSQGVLSAFTRWRQALNAYGDEAGIPHDERHKLVSAGASWSIDLWLAAGRGGEVQSRLDSAGVTLSDIPALRRAAEDRVAAYERARGVQP